MYRQQCSALLIDWNHRMKFKDSVFTILSNFPNHIIFYIVFSGIWTFFHYACSSDCLPYGCIFKVRRTVLINAMYPTTKCCQIIWHCTTVQLNSKHTLAHTHTSFTTIDSFWECRCLIIRCKHISSSFNVLNQITHVIVYLMIYFYFSNGCVWGNVNI